LKTTLVYPKIPDSRNCPLKKCVVFEKIDGTNIHFALSKGKWISFGTRRTSYPSSFEGEVEFRKEHPELSNVLDCDSDLLLDLQHLINNNPIYSKVDSLILFMEYSGPSSFAGRHKDNDGNLYLFDVQVDGKMLAPEILIKDFVEFEDSMPDVLYQGKYSGQLVEDIRNGKYKVNEGAVIKGTFKDEIYMVKVKTNKYLDKLKEAYQDTWEDYWE
jgi:hypothetical protein